MSGFDEDLLVYYQRELRTLRALGTEFATAYPKIAARLDVGAEVSPDPQVERLIESFAFLSARIQRTIDDDFPIIPEHMLGVLYPHLTAPLPSMSIIRIDPDPTQGALTTGHAVPRGTRLFAETAQGVSCRFRTAYDTVLWPLKVAKVVAGSTDTFPALGNLDAAAVVAVRLEATGAAPLEALPIERLRFFLGGDDLTSAQLYELLGCALSGVVVVPGDQTVPSAVLTAECIRPVGFADDEAVLPDPPQAHPGYRLVQEYFAFPEKYLFLDVTGLKGALRGRSVDLLFLLRQPPGKTAHIDASCFQLGCTPVINLFDRMSEPVRIDQTALEYRLVPDVRWEPITEIHSIGTLSASTDPRERAAILAPYFSCSHGEQAARAWYVARRLPSARASVPGTDMMLSFVDLDFQPARPAEQTVYAHLLCTNRGLAEQVPAGALLQPDQPLPKREIVLLRRPTAQIQPPLGGQTLWRLVSHLSLNHLSLDNTPEALRAFKEILRLYGVPGRAGFAQQIDGIAGMSVAHAVRRIGEDPWRGFVHGRAVDLTFDEAAFVGTSAYLLGAVLSRFFALYAGINSFTQLTIHSLSRDKEWKTWPPAAGALDVL